MVLGSNSILVNDLSISFFFSKHCIQFTQFGACKGVNFYYFISSILVLDIQLTVIFHCVSVFFYVEHRRPKLQL